MNVTFLYLLVCIIMFSRTIHYYYVCFLICIIVCVTIFFVIYTWKWTMIWIKIHIYVYVIDDRSFVVLYKNKKKPIKKQNNINPLHGRNPHQRLARIASLHVPINWILRHPLFIIRGKMLYLLFLFLKEKNNLKVVYKSSIFYPQIFVKNQISARDDHYHLWIVFWDASSCFQEEKKIIKNFKKW